VRYLVSDSRAGKSPSLSRRLGRVTGCIGTWWAWPRRVFSLDAGLLKPGGDLLCRVSPPGECRGRRVTTVHAMTEPVAATHAPLAGGVGAGQRRVGGKRRSSALFQDSGIFSFAGSRLGACSLVAKWSASRAGRASSESRFRFVAFHPSQSCDGVQLTAGLMAQP
jgi:hypothetical protein